MSDDLIRRSDAIKAMEQRYQDILRIFKRKVKDGEKAIVLDMIGCIKTLPSADRPQGEWIGYEVPSECSVCGHCWDEYVFGQEIWYDGSVPNYCPHCGARMKGADDESG